MVIGCELCGSPANTYCESDQARLCWSCDCNVHGANFLVAKHTRVLLCHHCQAHTSWAASGSRLTPSCSCCLSCLSSKAQEQPRQQHQLVDRDHDDDDDEGSCDDDNDDDDDDDQLETLSDDDDDEEEEEEDDNEENQVVPWAAGPPERNECEAEDCNSNGGLLKRKREFALLHSPSVIFQF